MWSNQIELVGNHILLVFHLFLTSEIRGKCLSESTHLLVHDGRCN